MCLYTFEECVNICLLLLQSEHLHKLILLQDDAGVYFG